MTTPHLGSLRLYKFDVPFESDVGVIVVSRGEMQQGQRIRLTRYTGRRRARRGSKAGLSKSFVDQIRWSFSPSPPDLLIDKIFDYIGSNFCFKDLEVMPPACPILVFHIHIKESFQDPAPEMETAILTRILLLTLRTKDSVLADEDAITRCVPITPPVTEILDCYQSSESCRLCEKGYPKEDDLVHKTRCNHIFHAACITRYLRRTLQCPVCSAPLPPVDIRTLLFS